MRPVLDCLFCTLDLGVQGIGSQSRGGGFWRRLLRATLARRRGAALASSICAALARRRGATLARRRGATLARRRDAAAAATMGAALASSICAAPAAATLARRRGGGRTAAAVGESLAWPLAASRTHRGHKPRAAGPPWTLPSVTAVATAPPTASHPPPAPAPRPPHGLWR